MVDSEKYNLSQRTDINKIRIGWIGTPNTQKYLNLISEVLRDFFLKYKGSLVVIGASSDFSLNDVPIEYLVWSEQTEAQQLGNIDIGIMPLPDKPLERGKSGLKLIQYLAAGKPVVASPVGVNVDIVTPKVGFLAQTKQEWLECLSNLAEDPARRREMGENARRMVIENYSLQTWGAIYSELIRQAALPKE